MFLNFGNHTWTTGSAWCRRNLRDFFTSFILTRFISLLSTNIISSFSYVLLFYYTAESFLLVLPIWFNIIGKKILLWHKFIYSNQTTNYVCGFKRGIYAVFYFSANGFNIHNVFYLFTLKSCIKLLHAC